MFQDDSKFLEAYKSALPLLSDRDNVIVQRERILELLSSNEFLYIEPSFSYWQLLPQDRTQYITPYDTIVSTVTSLVLQDPFNKSDIDRIWMDLNTAYHWIRNNIQYHNDSYEDGDGVKLTSVDVWQFPNQTVLLGAGDCEDQTLLLASLMLKYGNTTFYVECLCLQSLNGIGHVAMYLPIKGDAICILDPATGYTTSIINQDFISSQPIEQEIINYLHFLSQITNSIWSVTSVFSQDFTIHFSKTEDFTEWLIERVP